MGQRRIIQFIMFRDPYANQYMRYVQVFYNLCTRTCQQCTLNRLKNLNYPLLLTAKSEGCKTSLRYEQAVEVLDTEIVALSEGIDTNAKKVFLFRTQIGVKPRSVSNPN